MSILRFFRAVFRQLIGRECGNVAPVDRNGSGRRAVQTAQKVQKRAISRAGRSRNDDEPPLLKGQIHMVQRAQFVVAACVDSADFGKFYQCHCCSPLLSHLWLASADLLAQLTVSRN